MYNLLKIDFNKISHMTVKENPIKVFYYEDGKRTNKIKGYKYKFIVMDKNNPFYLKSFTVRFNSNIGLKVGQNVKIEYDVEHSKIYAHTEKDSNYANVNVSLVATNAKVVE